MKILIVLFAINLIVFTSCTKEEINPSAPTVNNPIDSNYIPIKDSVHAIMGGQWKCVENSATYGTQNYYVDVIRDTTICNKIYIDNFFGLGIGKQVIAIRVDTIFNISNQILNGITINGSGIISSNDSTIIWNYTINEANGSSNVVAIYTKM